MRGPGADDLADLGAGFYLDFPGDALAPGCLYEQDHDRFNAGQPSVVYAHIVHDAEHPDVLALQYWLYWYYNDWNNKHESDWEFVQLLFPASSVTEALATDPSSVGYAQHEGGEWADWDDAKLHREGTHPVVYSSQRSHASYFEPAVYIGRSASEGFGCDHTEAPSTRIEPAVVVLPDAVDGAADPLAWIGFEGRWGERHGGPNNGPTGPNTKAQWSDPVAWHDDLRDSSFVVPGDGTSAAQVIDAFCGIVEWGSVQYIHFVASPARVLLAVAVLGAAIAFLVRRTAWGRVAATPLRRRRRAGQILRLAARQLRGHPATFATAAALAVPLALLAALVGIVVSHAPVVGAFVEVADPTDAGLRLVISTIIASAVMVLPFTFISALVAAIVDGTDEGRAGIGAAVGAVRRRAGPLLTSLLLAVVSVVLVSFTVIGVPVAVWLVVRWQFLPQAVVLEHRRGRAALARSARLVRRRWWHTALVAAVTLGIVSAFGLTVGLILLVLFTGLPLWALSAIVAACNILAMPYGALVMTYLYGNALGTDDAPVDDDHDDRDRDVEPAPVPA
jgi:hypothetical protein